MKSDKAKEFLVAPISRDIQESRQRMNEIVDEAVFHIREEAFDAAEQWLRTQLLRWRDPKKEFPKEGEWVLLKLRDAITNDITYVVGDYAGEYRSEYPVNGINNIIGWRPIEE